MTKIQEDKHIYSSRVISILIFAFSIGLIALMIFRILQITKQSIFQHPFELTIVILMIALFSFVSFQSIGYLFRKKPLLSITHENLIIYPFLRSEITLKIDEIQSFSLNTTYANLGPVRAIIIRMGLSYKMKKKSKHKRMKKISVANNEVYRIPILYFRIGRKELVNLLSQRIKNME